MLVVESALAVWDEPAAYQLVGGVTAYYSDDGSRPERCPPHWDRYTAQTPTGAVGNITTGRKPDAATPRGGMTAFGL